MTHTQIEYVEPGPAARAALAEWAAADVRLYGLVVERFWALHAARGLPRLPNLGGIINALRFDCSTHVLGEDSGAAAGNSNTASSSSSSAVDNGALAL